MRAEVTLLAGLPQGLKSAICAALDGAAEAAPFRKRVQNFS
jgi:hypothetical protein